MAHRSLHPLLHYLRRLGTGAGGEADLDDAHLLRRFLGQRDETAFTALVQRYGAMVWGVCVRRLGETPDAEDAFQATFLVLARKGGSLRGSELLGPWLYGVAYRTALKAGGRLTRRKAREVPLPDQVGEASTAEQVWRDLRPVLDEEVSRLPEKYRQPVLLCYLEGLDTEEAARRLGCPKGTVFSRLSRARDLLRRRLSRRGVEVSGAVLAAVLAEQAAAKAAPPAALLESTIRLGVSFAAGTAGPVLSAPLAALVEGVLRSMFLSKVKLVVAVLLVLGIAGSGVGFLAHRTVAGPPAPAPTSAPSRPKGPAARAPAKAPEPGPAAPDGLAAIKDEKLRLRAWRERLNNIVQFQGIDDPKETLEEALDNLAKRYDLNFAINDKAFRAENLVDVGKTPIIEPKPIPAMKASLATVLRLILDRVPSESGTVYVLRPDHVEITTLQAVRTELGIPEGRKVLPLVWDAFEETPISQSLERLAEGSGYNVVTDARVADKLQAKITARFNNVPFDTAVRLLANMADLSVVRLDNVFYVTTADNARRLRDEQAQLNEPPPGSKPTSSKPTPSKPTK